VEDGPREFWAPFVTGNYLVSRAGDPFDTLSPGGVPHAGCGRGPGPLYGTARRLLCEHNRKGSEFMTTTRKRWVCLTVGVAFGHLLIGANPLKAQGDCKVVLEAANKTQTTATHTYTTMNMGGKDQTVEMIYTPGIIYSRINGKWSRTPMTPQELAELQKPKAHDDKATCKYLKDELVNGEMAAVYSAHDVSPKGVVDTQIWISKAKGLPLRQDMDIDVGGAGGKSHTSTRYEYGKRQAAEVRCPIDQHEDQEQSCREAMAPAHAPRRPGWALFARSTAK